MGHVSVNVMMTPAVERVPAPPQSGWMRPVVAYTPLERRPGCTEIAFS
eukprot:COSAG05_NODE_17675_length_321_cov_0.698198_1_plen_47_part_10